MVVVVVAMVVGWVECLETYNRLQKLMCRFVQADDDKATMDVVIIGCGVPGRRSVTK